jgi:hypothetical protein
MSKLSMRHMTLLLHSWPYLKIFRFDIRFRNVNGRSAFPGAEEEEGSAGPARYEAV